MEFLLGSTYHLLTSPFLLLSLLFGTSLAYILLTCLYRLTLHPLHHYPGPLLNRLTDLPQAYHAYLGSRHLYYHQLHEAYGPIVRVGPNQLSFNSATALKTIYGFRANVRKSDFYDAFPANKHTVNVHSSRDKSVHARKRRVLSHAFSDAAIRELERWIVGNVRTGVRVIGESIDAGAGAGAEKGWGKAWNASEWCGWLVFDIMGDLVFGKAFNMLESPENRFATELVSKAAHRHLICGTHLTIHKWHLDKILFRKIATQRAQYMQYSKAQATERTKMGLDVDRKDFFYHLLNAKDPETGEGFSMNELWGESNLLIIAGSDTTSTAMAGTLFYLAHNPTALQKLTKEIREAFSDVEEIVSGAKVSGCTYLRACIDETMRMTPPVAGALPREVLKGGIDIDGHHLPEGVVVGVPHYAIHHNEAYFPRPFDFIPERWLPSPAQNPLADKLALAHSAFCPFSIGPRGCIGKGLAYVELTITIARLLFLYELRLAPGTTLGEGAPDLEVGRKRSEEFQIMDHFASDKDGPMLQFRRRVCRAGIRED